MEAEIEYEDLPKSIELNGNIDFDYDDIFENVSDDFTKRLNLLRLDGSKPNSQLPDESLNWSKKTVDFPEHRIQAHIDPANKQKMLKRCRDPCDRATNEQVLDQRTRLILFRLGQRGVFDWLEGCVSTGKEANVYHAVCNAGTSLAVKIYKTSILSFRDRDRYVAGEHRYRHGYCRGNPRKMVMTWAEKEMRNLQRMHDAGLPVPKAHLLKGNILFMDFIGEDGWPAPLLKNAEFDDVTAEILYLDCVSIIRKMFRVCKLVHADLSEYNMLYHQGKLVVIDVSQSVEKTHVNALTFLRSDITNVTRFFRSKGSPVLTPQRLFELVTDPTIGDKMVQQILDDERTEDLKDDQNLFLSAYIPQKLENIEHFERDHKMEQDGLEPNNPYQKLIAKVAAKPDETSDDEGSGSAKSDGESSVTSSPASSLCKDTRTYQEKHCRYVRHRGESSSARRERKQAVREERRLKQKAKVPKHVKKRKEKLRARNR